MGKDNKSQSEEFDIYNYIKGNSVAKELFYSCYTMDKQRFYFSKRTNKFERVTNLELRDLIIYDYPILKKIDDKNKITLDLPTSFLSVTFFNNVIDMVVDKVDLFQPEPLKLKKIDRTLFITRNTYFLMSPKKIDHITDDVEKTIINDYKVHFPELDNILKWVVACRFTNDRRSSFLHLRLSAGFGKDFFQSILKDIGVLVECRYDDFKSPSSLRAGEFRNSFVMLINEFTIFKKDFKNFTHNMILDSKNQLRTEVELFAKIFLSAEHSNSFVDGVDKQITDRVNQINKDSKLELKDREAFIEYDNIVYYNVVYSYIYNMFKNEIGKYISLGKINASKRATKILRRFHDIYKLDVELLDDRVKRVFWASLLNIIENKNTENNLNTIEREISKNIIIREDATLQGNEYYYVKSFKKVFELIMKNEDEEFYKKARYKTSQLSNILGIKKEDIQKRHKVNGTTIVGFKFQMSEIVEFQDKEKIDFLYHQVEVDSDIHLKDHVLVDKNGKELF